jgi:hypothetical protein
MPGKRLSASRADPTARRRSDSALSPRVSHDSGDSFHESGMGLLIDELLFLSAAGIGVLGLIAGIVSSLVSITSSPGGG